MDPIEPRRPIEPASPVPVDQPQSAPTPQGPSPEQRVQQQAEGMKERGREKAHELKDEAQHRALDAAKKGKQSLSGHLRHISTALEAAAQRLREQDEGWLADYGQQAADGLERACESMESKEPKELLNEVEDYGRRSPTTFMESAFMGGLLLGRFLKSSARGQDEQTSESWATGEASASEAA